MSFQIHRCQRHTSPAETGFPPGAPSTRVASVRRAYIGVGPALGYAETGGALGTRGASSAPRPALGGEECVPLSTRNLANGGVDFNAN